MNTAEPGDPIGAVLVVGGGIGGMQASLDLADQGFLVYLAETQSAIGGHMAQLDKTFPTNDCAMCTISPKLIDVGRHRNIDLLLNTDVMKIDGQAGKFTATLRQRPRYIDPMLCVGCGDCAEVCPVSLPDPFEEGQSQRKAAYKLYPQAVPNAYAIQKKGVAPCRAACPAGQRAQGYIALIAQGRYREALRVIKEDNPFPSVCGRTCHHPCEGHCARAHVDEPINIMSLKRFVMDYALAYGRERVQPVARTKPEWVAIVGAGPAGLTAAHDLAKRGYGVTIYEALPVAGGMMRVGIPAHRLPKGVLQQDIDDILALGVVLKTNAPIHNPTQLLAQGYDAVCLATGISRRDHNLGIPGEHLEGVLSAATFLRKVNLGEPIAIGARVAVAGGGITALDAAAVACRLGAQEVHLLLDRPRGELPAYHLEMTAVEAEGIRFIEGATPIEVLAANGRVGGIVLAKTGRGMQKDSQGRMRPRLIEGSEEILEVDTLIATVGQQSDLCYLDPAYEDLEADPATLSSEIPGMFIVGGRKTGASYIIEAIALGHQVAASIDQHLQGIPLEGKNPSPPTVQVDRKELSQQVMQGQIEIRKRAEPTLLTMQERVTSFREVVLGLSERQARAEAQRCLQCGDCAECLACEEACGRDAIRHSEVEHHLELDVGAVILAPGYQTFAAETAQEFGLGRYPNVITSLQLERLLNASGPTQGQVRRPSDQAIPKRVAFLQCIGSRDQEHAYCSSICCMAATKEAMLLREHHPTSEVEIFLMDARAFSKGYEAYYRRAQDEFGIKYTRCRVSQVQESSQDHRLKLRFIESGAGSSIIEQWYDLVVLSVGMQIPAGVRELGERLDLGLDQYGFCRTREDQPVESSRPGIYAVGPFRGPKDIPETVIDAGAAAALAGIQLASVRGTLSRSIRYPPERDLQAEPVRIGVFVCHCGSNIAGFVDVHEARDYAAQLAHVTHAEDLLYACSQDSTARIQACIEELELNRVVVASCTPLTHAALFQDCIRQAGLNEGLFSMANIRNHCSWVHSQDRTLATSKAKDLIRMAAARAATLQPLHTMAVNVRQSALVVGGGPAGLHAALTIADQGFPVHLVEERPTLGGRLRHSFFAIPLDPDSTTYDPQRRMQDLVSAVETHPGIRLHMGSSISETKGFIGNFQTTLRSPGEDPRTIEHGVTILTPGGEEYRGQEYGYGQSPAVRTQQEFEALLAEQAGLIPRKETDAIPLETIRHVTMIQCIGPAEQVCARTCCIDAMKNALQMKSQNPKAQVTILYRDMRTYGLYERLYQQALAQGVIFIRTTLEAKPRVSFIDQQPIIDIVDPVLQVPLQLHPDLLVLSMPLVPGAGNRSLASAFKVPVDEHGWLLEAHVKLRPVEFTSEGIYVAGVAHYPKLLSESIVQAQAAASRAATVLCETQREAGGVVAHVQAEQCVGCLTCVRLCPFGAPRMTWEHSGVGQLGGAAKIEASLCQGCGICVGACPAGAIELEHYRHHQVEREVLAGLEHAALRPQQVGGSR